MAKQHERLEWLLYNTCNVRRRVSRKHAALLNTHCTKLLCVGASLTDVDHEGLNALSWAAISGHLHCVEWMLDRGCDINHNDNIKRTPLHLASFYGHEQVVRSVFCETGQYFPSLLFKTSILTFSRFKQSQMKCTVSLPV